MALSAPYRCGMRTLDLPEMARLRTMAASGEARRLRIGAGLGLAEVAREVDVVPSTLSRWERGLLRPHGVEAARWFRLLAELTAVAA